MISGSTNEAVGKVRQERKISYTGSIIRWVIVVGFKARRDTRRNHMNENF